MANTHKQLLSAGIYYYIVTLGLKDTNVEGDLTVEYYNERFKVCNIMAVCNVVAKICNILYISIAQFQMLTWYYITIDPELLTVLPQSIDQTFLNWSDYGTTLYNWTL